MLKISLYSINKFIVNFIVILSGITGIIKYFIGSFWAETILLVFIALFMIMLLHFKKKYDFLDILFLFVALYSVLITFINIMIGDVSAACLVGIYYYTLPCLIFLNRNNPFFKRNSRLYFEFLFVILVINSIYAMYQTVNPNAFISSEMGRARGLMKATLNYSGIIGASFFPIIALQIKNNFLKISGFICICVGGLLTLSRGLIANIASGIFASYPLMLIIKNKLSKSMLKWTLVYGVVILLVMYGIILYLSFTDQLQYFERLFHIVDYKHDAANNIRAGFYGSFINYFLDNPFGHGVGRLVSGTTYVDNCVNFESYILGALYSIGFVALIYISIPIIWMYRKLLNVDAKYQQLSIMFIFGILLQNLVQAPMLTPTTLIITWLNIIFFTYYIINLNNFVKLQKKKKKKIRFII